MQAAVRAFAARSPMFSNMTNCLSTQWSHASDDVRFCVLDDTHGLAEQTRISCTLLELFAGDSRAPRNTPWVLDVNVSGQDNGCGPHVMILALRMLIIARPDRSKALQAMLENLHDEVMADDIGKAVRRIREFIARCVERAITNCAANVDAALAAALTPEDRDFIRVVRASSENLWTNVSREAVASDIGLRRILASDAAGVVPDSFRRVNQIGKYLRSSDYMLSLDMVIMMCMRVGIIVLPVVTDGAMSRFECDRAIRSAEYLLAKHGQPIIIPDDIATDVELVPDALAYAWDHMASLGEKGRIVHLRNTVKALLARRERIVAHPAPMTSPSQMYADVASFLCSVPRMATWGAMVSAVRETFCLQGMPVQYMFISVCRDRAHYRAVVMHVDGHLGSCIERLPFAVMATLVQSNWNM